MRKWVEAHTVCFAGHRGILHNITTTAARPQYATRVRVAELTAYSVLAHGLICKVQIISWNLNLGLGNIMYSTIASCSVYMNLTDHSKLLEIRVSRRQNK